MSKKCINYFISGKVHGVWFRNSTQKMANQLGLKGWVRNLADGRVEVLACGNQEALNQLTEWLKVGPLLAKVTEVTQQELTWQEHPTFEIR